jgi:DNA-binding NtrC family response regulator
VLANQVLHIHTILLALKNNTDSESILSLLKRPDRKILLVDSINTMMNIWLEHKEIEMVFISMNLAFEHGLNTLERIKKFRPEIPIVLLSDFISLESIRLATLAGCNEIIQNPINEEALNAVVQKYLPDYPDISFSSI